jgi:mono/diheme cytochrome c family protein
MIVRGVAAGFAVTAALIGFSWMGTAAAQSNGQSKKVARGKYLVDNVGKCGDCHTPLDEKGQPIMDKYLKGATLVFKPIIPMPVWAERAPTIAGLKGWDEKEAIHFLMTGETPANERARPPMPEYRFNQEDASAVVAYLRSLGSQGK